MSYVPRQARWGNMVSERARLDRDYNCRVAHIRRQHELGRNENRRSRENSAASIGYIGKEREKEKVVDTRPAAPLYPPGLAAPIRYPPGLGPPSIPAVPSRHVQNDDILRTSMKMAARDAARAAKGREAAIHMFEPGQTLAQPSLVHWYAQTVVSHIVTPGMYRAGTKGASETAWGPDAIRHRGFSRMGSFRFPPVAQPIASRNVDQEPFDPYELGVKHCDGPTSRFFDTLHGIIMRLRIPDNTVIAAAWYISRLGLHEGDPKGAALREILYKSKYKRDAVEIRVAFLGLYLAHKWVDDADATYNLYTWSTLLGIKQKDLRELEFAALGDMLCTLNIDHIAWKAYLRECIDTLRTPTPIEFPITDLNIRTFEMALANAEAIDRQWNAERTLSVSTQAQLDRIHVMPNPIPAYDPFDFDLIPSDEYPGCPRIVPGSPDEMSLIEAYATTIPLPVVSNEEAIMDDDDDDDYVEYDGAKPFITKADIRRASDARRSPAVVEYGAPLRRARSNSFVQRNEPVPAAADDAAYISMQDKEDKAVGAAYAALALYLSPALPDSNAMAPSASNTSFRSWDSSEALMARTPECFGYTEDDSGDVVMEDAGNTSVDAVEAIVSDSRFSSVRDISREFTAKVERACFSFSPDLDTPVREPRIPAFVSLFDPAGQVGANSTLFGNAPIHDKFSAEYTRAPVRNAPTVPYSGNIRLGQPFGFAGMRNNRHVFSAMNPALCLAR